MRWLVLTMVVLQSMACGDGAEGQCDEPHEERADDE